MINPQPGKQKDLEQVCFKEVNNLVKRLREDDGRTLDFMLLYQTVCTVIYGNFTISNFPNLEEIFKERKSFIIKFLLEDIASDGISRDFAGETIDKFIKIGIDWPELAIMKKSIDYELAMERSKNLLESNSNKLTAEKVVNRIVNILKMYSGLDNRIDRLVDLDQVLDKHDMLHDPITYEEYKSVLTEEIKHQIVSWVNSFISKNPSAGFWLLPLFTKIGIASDIIPILEKNKKSIITRLLTLISNGNITAASEFAENINGIGINWSELTTIIKSLNYDLIKTSDESIDEARNPMVKKIPVKKALTSSKKLLGPEKIPTGGGQFIKNPAWLPTAKYEGDPKNFDFGAQKRNYKILSDVLERQGKKFNYIGVAVSGAGTDIFVATAPGLVWYKYVGNNPQSGQNYLYINGAKIKTSSFVGWPAMLQNEILSKSKEDVIWFYNNVHTPYYQTPYVTPTAIQKGNLEDINRSKSEIVKTFLEFVKKNTLYYSYHILSDIDRLEKLGIDWNELSTIKRSLRHELSNRYKQIQENTNINEIETSEEHNKRTAHNLIDYINDQIIDHASNFDITSQFSHAVNSIEQLDLQPSVFEYLDPNKVKNILKWFKQTLSTDPYYAFRSMPFFVKAQFQLNYVRKFIEQEKPNIIRHLLRYFTDGMPGRASVNAERLNDLGIDWPELKTIITSGRVELKRMSDTGQLDESDDLDARHVVATQVFRDRNEQQARRIMAGLNAAVDGNFLFNTIADFDSARQIIDLYKIEPREFKQAVNPETKIKIYNWFNKYISGDNYNNTVLMLKILSFFKKTMVLYPEIQQLLEENKRTLVRIMLQYVKNNQIDFAYQMSSYLKNFGITWPELDIIERSAEHERDSKK